MDAAEAQAVQSAPQESAELEPDSAQVLGAARRAQASFERHRVRLLPVVRASYAGSCDERVGRLCSWDDGADWRPEPEGDELARLRTQLVRTLDSLGRVAPGDPWILGQRVAYWAEGGGWAVGLAAARRCGGVDPWWCSALEGFALHGLGRYQESLRAFEEALELMDDADARRWRVPEWPIDGRARRYIDDADPDSLDAVLSRLWVLADPLYLVPGNDRITAHYSRWTLAHIRRRARNPLQISWGRDLDQLTVRNGWELGWERDQGRGGSAADQVVGHKHPEGRDFMPSGRGLMDPAGASPGDLRADRVSPRSLYAPAYAPLLLPAEGQVALFPRGEEIIVVATHFLPEDTTDRSSSDGPRPWMDPGAQTGRAHEAGLFLIPESGEGVWARRTRGRSQGALALRAPAGGYVVSVEHWSPPDRRAGRHRFGLRMDTVPEDVAALSDILLLRGGGGDPGSLEAALSRALVRPSIRSGEPLGIVFEVSGLGWRPEELDFELSVERAGRNLLQRAGQALGLLDRDRPLSLAWLEQGPERPEPLLRWLTLDLQTAEPGEYELRILLSIPGRTGLSKVRRFTIEG